MGRGARVLRRVALVLALATATACQQAQLQAPFASQPPAQLPLQLEIPDGYRGYVVLQYALASCAVLPRRDGYTVIRFAVANMRTTEADVDLAWETLSGSV